MTTEQKPEAGEVSEVGRALAAEMFAIFVHPAPTLGTLDKYDRAIARAGRVLSGFVPAASLAALQMRLARAIGMVYEADGRNDEPASWELLIDGAAALLAQYSKGNELQADAEAKRRSAELGLELFQQSAAVVEERNSALSEQLATAETKADAYERAAAAQARTLSEALLELASERASREHLIKAAAEIVDAAGRDDGTFFGSRVTKALLLRLKAALESTPAPRSVDRKLPDFREDVLLSMGVDWTWYRPEVLLDEVDEDPSEGPASPVAEGERAELNDWREWGMKLCSPPITCDADMREHIGNKAESTGWFEQQHARSQQKLFAAREGWDKALAQLRAQAAEREALLHVYNWAWESEKRGYWCRRDLQRELAKLDALRSQPTPTVKVESKCGGNCWKCGTKCSQLTPTGEVKDSSADIPAFTNDVAPVAENTGQLSSPVAPAAEGEACGPCDGSGRLPNPGYPEKNCGDCDGSGKEPPPASPPASDAGGESKFKPRCMVLVRGKHRCIKDEGHGPDNDLGDVVHQDERGELFCEQGKLASPEALTKALRDAEYELGETLRQHGVLTSANMDPSHRFFVALLGCVKELAKGTQSK